MPTASTPYQTLLQQYNTVPSPTSGQGPYGAVPGTTTLPPSTFTQTTAAVPGLGQPASDQLTSNIMSELQGELSPQVLANLQNQAATFGISSGMPGSNAIPGTLANNSNLLANVETTQQLQHSGEQDYLSALAGIGAQQLNPSLISSVNQGNAELAAAPNPTEAAQTQLANYYAALNAARGPGAGSAVGPGPAGGTGVSAPFSGGTPSPNYPTTVLGQPGTATTSSFTQSANPNDPSNPASWDFTDPSLWGDTAGSGTLQPAGTVNTDTSSYYDPFAQFGGFGDLSGG